MYAVKTSFNFLCMAQDFPEHVFPRDLTLLVDGAPSQKQKMMDEITSV
jgi:hypothetical protein